MNLLQQWSTWCKHRLAAWRRARERKWLHKLTYQRVNKAPTGCRKDSTDYFKRTMSDR